MTEFVARPDGTFVCISCGAIVPDDYRDLHFVAMHSARAESREAPWQKVPEATYTVQVKVTRENTRGEHSETMTKRGVRWSELEAMAAQGALKIIRCAHRSLKP